MVVLTLRPLVLMTFPIVIPRCNHLVYYIHRSVFGTYHNTHTIYWMRIHYHRALVLLLLLSLFYYLFFASYVGCSPYGIIAFMPIYLGPFFFFFLRYLYTNVSWVRWLFPSWYNFQFNCTCFIENYNLPFFFIFFVYKFVISNEVSLYIFVITFKD